MNWFESLTGFVEQGYESTRNKLVFDGSVFYSKINHIKYDLGVFELASLASLRQRVSALNPGIPVTKPVSAKAVAVHVADAYALHRESVANGAVIQVASQFNLLEMPSPRVTPESGVTNYMYDGTQGPACAMAAGPATLFRNYGIPVAGQFGQTESVQVNTIDHLLAGMGNPAVTMQNGYAMCSRSVLEQIHDHLHSLNETEIERLKGLLKVGVHWHTAVTAKGAAQNQKVTQVYCSALPLAYNDVHDPELWEPFARLILEACYEATVCVGVLNAIETKNPNLFLTRVGGGVFGNQQTWIEDAMRLAVSRHASGNLNVKLVSRG